MEMTCKDRRVTTGATCLRAQPLRRSLSGGSYKLQPVLFFRSTAVSMGSAQSVVAFSQKRAQEMVLQSVAVALSCAP